MKKEKFYYCQLQIEQDKWCKTQCEHCKEYYKPLEQERKKEQKEHLINIMKADEEIGLYDIFNEEKTQSIKEMIDRHNQETVCGKLPDNMGFPHFKTGIVEQPNEIPNKENGKVYLDQHGREFLQTEHGRIILTKQTRHLFDNINEQ